MTLNIFTFIKSQCAGNTGKLLKIITIFCFSIEEESIINLLFHRTINMYAFNYYQATV